MTKWKSSKRLDRTRSISKLNTFESRNWNNEYALGNWSFLSEPNEQWRMALIAAIAQEFACRTVVDVGCGPGYLSAWLDPNKFQNYVGIDISSEAFGNPLPSKLERTWITTALEEYYPKKRIDGSALIFSEILYYIDNPDFQLERVAAALNSKCIIVSNTVPGKRYAKYQQRVAFVWSALEELGWKRLNDITLTNHPIGDVSESKDVEPTSWRITAFRPHDE
ncbi:class I SAM-dependent methyltransferase [Lentilitoribacter sp. EG35]|uniref:class I SAM-dependent methyltransferase n=1 Tax=Lentilitoribacter sp. EG35 TaxID=3234192 RepID=UPI00346020EF